MPLYSLRRLPLTGLGLAGDFRRPWIRISSATLVYQWFEQIQEQNTWRFVAKCFSWPVVQLILNPAYLPITDVSEIGLFGEILPDESVGILIQPFLPRMVGAAKIGFRC